MLQCREETMTWSEKKVVEVVRDVRVCIYFKADPVVINDRLDMEQEIKRVVEDYSNIFVLCNWKNGVVINWHGKILDELISQRMLGVPL